MSVNRFYTDAVDPMAFNPKILDSRATMTPVIGHKAVGPLVSDDRAGGPIVVDFHVHFGSPRDEASGCYWSEKFEKTAAYAAMLLLTKHLFQKISFSAVHRHLIGVIRGSRFVNQAVLLALDQVYDGRGKVRPEWTHLHVPNRCIRGIAAGNPRILFGASVHPLRPDWEDALDESLELGAVLCKWIPSAQMIDLREARTLSRFYQKLSDSGLPLLCHAGPEYSIPSSFPDAEAHAANDPENLRPALEAGVTVVIAHCALPYFGVFDRPYEDDFRAFLELFNQSESRRWNLYADLSALTGCFRLRYVREEILRLPHERLLMGSDYPIPISELSHNRRADIFSWLRFILRMMRLKNPLDKNYLLIREMGFNDCVFTNARGLFSAIRRPDQKARG
jgi:predicted TIM-barrel fold metal-dependent hydrolase